MPSSTSRTTAKRSRSSRTTSKTAQARPAPKSSAKRKRCSTRGKGAAGKRRARSTRPGFGARLGNVLLKAAIGGGRAAFAWVAPRVRFVHVLIALLLAVLYVHDVRFEWRGQGPGISPSGRTSPGASGPQLASFAHPAAHSSGDVQRLRADYIAAYAPVARAEMAAYGIPASITLAQGLLESVAGTSRLATATNNHFGIKCFSKRCAPGHCRNFGDDHHKDFFRAYADPRESYRAHSEFLRNGKRYARLFDLGADDYVGWARGLRAAGYATDPQYADKLIGLIERYDLTAYDEGVGGGWF